MQEQVPPLWRQVRDELARDVRQARFLPGDRLPTEQQLSGRFGVHRHTIRRALQELREMGLVRTEQGCGTTVLEQPLAYKMSRRTRFSEIMGQSSLAAGSHFLYGDLISASEVVAERLKLPPRSRVSYIETYGEAGGKRLFVSSQYIPYVGLENVIEVFKETGSLTKSYSRFGLTDYFRETSRISTRLANGEEVRHLRLKQRQPVLVVEYVNVDTAGRPIEFGITRFCGERLEIVVPGL